MPRASVTITDVAKAAGVSKSAAARVLARSGSASAATRERVLKAADMLGYRPNLLARAMKSGITNTIGVVIPDVSIPFFSSVLRGLADKARAGGFEILVSNTDNDGAIEARSLELLAEQQVEGIAIAPVFQKNPSTLLQLADEGMPLVLLDRRMPGLEHLPFVSVDHVQATKTAIDALIELGHERIALLAETSPPISKLQTFTEKASSHPELSLLRPSAQRIIGYLRAMKEHNLGIDEELILHSSYTTNSAQDAVIRFLKKGCDITALHATDAVLSSGAYRGIRSLGLSVPEHLSFVGFDDQEWTIMVQPRVSVVEQPREQLGAVAATLLMKTISGSRPEPLKRLLQPELLMRDSVVDCAIDGAH